MTTELAITTALLHKVRKGATSSFNVRNWKQVFEACGWKAEDGRALVPATERDLRGEGFVVEPRVRSSRDGDDFATVTFMAYRDGDLTKLRNTREQLLMRARSASNIAALKGLKLRALEILNVTDITSTAGEFPHFTAHIRVVKKALTITAPDGHNKTWNLAEPGYTITGWLKDHGIVEAACKLLGIDSVEDEAKRIERKKMADERRATCPCCFRGIKYQPDALDETLGGGKDHFDSPEHRDAARIVKHGYTQAPGRGEHISPDCFGAGFQPFEVSDAGTRALLAQLQEQLVGAERKLGHFDDNAVALLMVEERMGHGLRGYQKVEITPADARWPQAFAVAHENARNNVKNLRSECWQLASYIANWTAQPLPR